MMDFYAVLDQAVDLLRQCGPVTYRALKLQFELDDDRLAALKDELLHIPTTKRPMSCTSLAPQVRFRQRRWNCTTIFCCSFNLTEKRAVDLTLMDFSVLVQMTHGEVDEFEEAKDCPRKRENV